MANYTTSTSDKSKKKAITFLLCGGIGLHLFYVGRIKAGFVRLFFGILMWSLIVSGTKEGEAAMIATGICFLVLLNVIDFFKLLLGTFKDNVGCNLRK